MSEYREQHDELQLELAADHIDRARDLEQLLGEHREGEADMATFREDMARERRAAELAELARIERLTAAERAREYTERINRPRPTRGGSL